MYTLIYSSGLIKTLDEKFRDFGIDNLRRCQLDPSCLDVESLTKVFDISCLTQFLDKLSPHSNLIDATWNPDTFMDKNGNTQLLWDQGRVANQKSLGHARKFLLSLKTLHEPMYLLSAILKNLRYLPPKWMDGRSFSENQSISELIPPRALAYVLLFLAQCFSAKANCSPSLFNGPRSPDNSYHFY